jgi:hypothetical protein
MSRKIVPLLVVAALGAAWALCVPRGDPLAAQPAGAGQQKLPRLLTAKPVEIMEERDEMRKLLRARYNAALEEVRGRYHQFRDGQGKLEPMFDAFRRLLASGVAAADTGKDQVEFLELYVDLTRQVAKSVDGLAKIGGQIPSADAAQARYMHLDAQIQLLHAQRRLAGPAGVKRP